MTFVVCVWRYRRYTGTILREKFGKSVRDRRIRWKRSRLGNFRFGIFGSIRGRLPFFDGARIGPSRRSASHPTLHPVPSFDLTARQRVTETRAGCLTSFRQRREKYVTSPENSSETERRNGSEKLTSKWILIVVPLSPWHPIFSPTPFLSIVADYAVTVVILD